MGKQNCYSQSFEIALLINQVLSHTDIEYLIDINRKEVDRIRVSKDLSKLDWSIVDRRAKTPRRKRGQFTADSPLSASAAQRTAKQGVGKRKARTASYQEEAA